MISHKKWTGMSPDEKLDTLHEEVTKTEKSTRSLKKFAIDLMGRLNEIRRYMGMKPTA